MEILVLGAICLYSVSACIWVAWKELSIAIVHTVLYMYGVPFCGHVICLYITNVVGCY